MDDWSSAKLCDVANLILGMILFFSPWLFDLSNGVQWQAASTIGILIAVLSIAALAASAVWEEWLNLIAELTLIVSSWLLGFQDSDAMSIDAAIGEMWLAHRREAMGRKPLTPDRAALRSALQLSVK